MEIKKKYIKLFETTDMLSWKVMNVDSIMDNFNLSKRSAEDILINFVQWVKRFDGDLLLPTYRGDALYLDNIEYIGGSLDLFGSYDVASLENLEYVGGYLDLFDCEYLIDLPSLKYVGSFMDIRGCSSLKELPSLEYVGSNISINGSGITKEYLINKTELRIHPNSILGAD